MLNDYSKLDQSDNFVRLGKTIHSKKFKSKDYSCKKLINDLNITESELRFLLSFRIVISHFKIVKIDNKIIAKINRNDQGIFLKEIN